MSFPPSYHTARAKSQRELSGEVSRAKAVRTALELFATSGFKGTSIAKVAAESGLSQSGLLHHFPSKVALLSAVLEERDAEDGVFLTNEDGEAPLGWDAFDALEALVARNSRTAAAGRPLRPTVRGGGRGGASRSHVDQGSLRRNGGVADGCRPCRPGPR